MINFKKISLQSFEWVDVGFVLVIFIAIFLRFWQLETTMIFFGDIGRDFIVAEKMISKGEIPLLGIPSSVPRFHQGPVMIWFIALGLFLSNGSPVFVGYMTAFLGVLTVLYLFILMRSYASPSAALFASAILAASPLAVAHSRMPYHTAPLPFMTVFFLHMLLIFNSKHPKRWSGLWLGFAWACLFQFELATLPLLFLIPLSYLYQRKTWRKFPAIKVLAGLLIGLLPQLIYDLTHQFSHMGGFAIWVVYRVVAFLGYGGEHTVSTGKFTQTVHILSEYFSRIIFMNNAYIMWVILGVSLLLTIKYFKKKNRIILNIELATVTAIMLLLVAFFIHSSPSEAYFPPFTVLLAIWLGSMMDKLEKPLLYTSILMLIMTIGWNTVNILQSNFFVEPNNSAISYGPGYSEQATVIRFIIDQAGEESYKLSSIDSPAHFPAYLDGYRYLAQYFGKAETIANPSNIFFIQQENDELENNPGAVIYKFPSLSVIRL